MKPSTCQSSYNWYIRDQLLSEPVNHPAISSHDASLIPLTLPDLFLELPVAKQPGLGEDPFLDSTIMAKIGSVANKWVTYGHWSQRGHSKFVYSCLHYSDRGNDVKKFHNWTFFNYSRFNYNTLTAIAKSEQTSHFECKKDKITTQYCVQQLQI